MYNILLIVVLSIGYTNNIYYQLLDLLYEDENWISGGMRTKQANIVAILKRITEVSGVHLTKGYSHQKHTRNQC